VLFELSADEGIARISINRPEKRNAFRPRTVSELYDAFARVRDNPRIGVVLFTGAGPAADGAYAFCAGGDQSVRGDGGYLDEEGTPRLNVLDLQRLIRSLPKVVIALVAGYAIGGGQVLHLLCDLSIAADNAGGGVFEQLPIPRQSMDFDRLFAMPQSCDAMALAAAHGVAARDCSAMETLAVDLQWLLEPGDAIRLLRCSTDRARDAQLRQQLREKAWWEQTPAP